jgi:hypothetical protein
VVKLIYGNDRVRAIAYSDSASILNPIRASPSILLKGVSISYSQV